MAPRPPEPTPAESTPPDELAGEGVALEAVEEIAGCTDIASLEEVRVRWLGRKGLLTEQLKGLGALPAAERPAAGARINVLKDLIQKALEDRRVTLERGAVERALAAGAIDVTLPGRGESIGGLHPVTQARLRL